ncbi:MAG: hypothetical protein ACRDQH_15045, partial [Pseudonocardiaceae bacterium]
YVTNALVESKAWLAVASKGTDPRRISEFRAFAATLAEATKQRNLAQEIQMDAQELVRRAEQGIGQAIRNGQEAGTVARKGNRGGNNQYQSGNLPDENISSPADFFPAGGGAQTDSYAMADATEEQFESALNEARSEGNLSRANIVRKIKNNDQGPDVLKTQKRRPLTDVARSTGWEIRKVAERIERIVADDRLAENKQQVTAALRNHLLYVADAVASALAQLPEHNHQGA